MGRKTDEEIKVLTFYDGDTEAADAFADVIRYKLRQDREERRKSKITTGTGEKVHGEAYNGGEVHLLPDPAPRLCG